MSELPQDMYELQALRAGQQQELTKAHVALAAARAHLHLELRRAKSGGGDVDQALADADAALEHCYAVQATLDLIADTLSRHLRDLNDARLQRLRERG